MGIVSELNTTYLLGILLKELHDKCANEFSFPDDQNSMVIRYTTQTGVGMPHALEADFSDCARMMRAIFVEAKDTPATQRELFALVTQSTRKTISIGATINDVRVKYVEEGGVVSLTILVVKQEEVMA